jgi:hypothetical protein
MSSFYKCFSERLVENTIYGERIIGFVIDVEWYIDTPALAYYTFFNIILMVIFLVIGFWKTEFNRMDFKRFSIILWQLSILFVAFSVTVTGLTRLTLFWASAHSFSEYIMTFAILRSVKRNLPKAVKYGYIIFGVLYFFAEALLAEVPPIDYSYSFVAYMGAPIDFTACGMWFVAYYKNQVKFWPFFAFTFHIIYIFMLFLNCFLVPWGRIIGLGLNTLAIFFASMPATRNSWRFVELLHTLGDENDIEDLPTITKSSETVPSPSTIRKSQEKPQSQSQSNGNHKKLDSDEEPDITEEMSDFYN